jgi:hypothetical protein
LAEIVLLIDATVQEGAREKDATGHESVLNQHPATAIAQIPLQ